MRRAQWRGTILFTVIMVVMGATVGLRLYGLGGVHTVTASPKASATATSTPSTVASATTKTIIGAVEQNPYGLFQVQATFTGSVIASVQVVQSPGDAHSQRINEEAIPILTKEALAAQSAKIDTVTGATYSSESYKQSLQSAIDQL